MTTTDKTSEIIDRFYVDHGPCCAGCDWWRYANSVAGEYTRYDAIQAIKEMVAGTPLFAAPVECKRHPDAPHGFDRSGSHNAGRYVCTCESWTPGEAS